jgi:hypothetical protein
VAAASPKGDGTRAGGSSRVTIRQVATYAGVSEAAVSYALNGRPGVSEKTRAKVLEAARALGWAPNIDRSAVDLLDEGRLLPGAGG